MEIRPAEAQRRINPAVRPSRQLRPDGSPDDNDRVEIGPTALAFSEWAALGLEAPNLEAMREYRLQRIVQQLQAHNLAGILLFDPLNICSKRKLLSFRKITK